MASSSYGIPYMGSKDKIIHKISSCLPRNAENFYDLFGGGFAVSHYMAFHKKYKYIHYNEIESTTVELVKDAIAGKYNYKVFKPPWISREEFFFKKDTCAYTRIFWSFGNNQKGYIFGKEIEHDKKSLHNAVVFNEFDDNAIKLLSIKSFPEASSIKARRLKLKVGDIIRLQQLQQLQRLQQLERLERLQRLEQLTNIEFSSQSYENVIIKPNSIIYCDPPYKNTASYLGSFDHDKFWDWVRSNKNPVYVSEYTAPKDIKIVAAFRHNGILNGGKQNKVVEKLFWNGVSLQ